MNADTNKLLRVGDRVRFRDNSGSSDWGTVTELLPGEYARVRWTDLPVTTTHSMQALAVAMDASDFSRLLEALSDLGREYPGE
jgi:hypothetical protein